MSKEALAKIKTELLLRGFSENTVTSYVLHNRKFFEFIKKKPEKVTGEDIKGFLSNLIEKKLSASSISLVRSALKFFYEEILKKDIFRGIKAPKKERKLPDILTKEEVAKLLDVITNKKSRLILSILYSSGLRLSEVLNLKEKDLQFEERVGWVRQGKGKKDRIFILSDKIIPLIKEYINGKQKTEHLFPGKKEKMSARNIQKMIAGAANRAGITKKVSPHTLRHSYATHLLESGVDIRKIQALLGHANLNTTQLYAQVSTEELKKIKSPFDDVSD